MAEGWYRALAGGDAREEVIEAMRSEPFPELQQAEDNRELARARRRRARDARQDSSR